MNDGDRKRFEEILYRIQKIAKFVDGIDEQEFFGNELIKDACHANLIILSEAMSRMTVEIKESHLELNWREIIGFRNLIIHEYFRVNWKTVWEVITIDLKVLELNVQRIINED